MVAHTESATLELFIGQMIFEISVTNLVIRKIRVQRVKKAWADSNSQYHLDHQTTPDLADIKLTLDGINNEFDQERLLKMVIEELKSNQSESEMHPILQRKLNELKKPKKFFGLKFPLSSESLTDWHTHWVTHRIALSFTACPK